MLGQDKLNLAITFLGNNLPQFASRRPPGNDEDWRPSLDRPIDEFPADIRDNLLRATNRALEFVEAAFTPTPPAPPRAATPKKRKADPCPAESSAAPGSTSPSRSRD